jgi:hypothetical protein
LVLTDRLDARPLLVVIAALIVIRPLWWYGVRSGSAWWYSTRRHSVAEYEDLHHGTETGDVAPDERALTSARWQPPPPPTPLTDPDQARAVAALLAGRPGPGDIDILATINAKAARRPLTTVPRRRRWNTSQGMHLHIDTGPALEPYRHDIDRLRNALVAIASTHAVIELGFDGDPRAITHPRRVVGRRGCLPLADRLPPPETPVLVVTDLGIAVPHTGSPPAPIAFLDHYHLLTQAGCAVHYLVPYPRDRWPPALRDLPILYWEDGLGATTVLAGLRRRARR